MRWGVRSEAAKDEQVPDSCWGQMGSSQLLLQELEAPKGLVQID